MNFCWFNIILQLGCNSPLALISYCSRIIDRNIGTCSQHIANANKLIRSQRRWIVHNIVCWCSGPVRVPIEMTHIVKLIRMEKRRRWPFERFPFSFSLRFLRFDRSFYHVLDLQFGIHICLLVCLRAPISFNTAHLLYCIKINLQIGVCFTFD